MNKEIRKKLFNPLNWMFCGDHEGLHILFDQRILKYINFTNYGVTNIYFWYNKKLYRIENTKLKYTYDLSNVEDCVHRVLCNEMKPKEGKFTVYIPYTFKEIRFGNWLITKILFLRILWFYKWEQIKLKYFNN